MHRGLQAALAFSGLLVLAFVAMPSDVQAFGGDGNITNYVPPEKCDDTIDNDGDGLVNEGCPELCDDSIDNDQDGTVNEAPPCLPNTCFNGNNDNTFDGTDTSDLACVKPIGGYVPPNVKDSVEGNIWDTDLSETMGGPKSQGIMFSGHVYRGSTTRTMDKADTGTNTMTEYYIDKDRSEGDSWAFGFLQSKTYSESDFTFGDAIVNGRVIYHPSPELGKNEIQAASCGDALENEGTRAQQGDGDSKTGPDSPDDLTDDTTTCRADYGRVNEKYEIEYWYDDKGETNMKCEDDEASCSGGACNSCGTCTAASCSLDEDNTDDTGNYYWQTDGDDIYKDKCTVDCTDCVATDSCDSSCSDCCPPCGKSGCSGGSCDWDSAEGNERSWEEVQRNDCNDHNIVDGGSSSGSGDRNDEAATYTEFTSYSDNNWGNWGVNEDGRVWCAYEFTTTVDADGPRGYGDGLVVIENRASDGQHSTNPGDYSILGTKAHNGNDEVGQRVWVDGSYMSARGKIDLECPGEHEVCIKYVDYWTDDSGWDTTSSGNGWKDAVNVDTVHTMLPEDSYSVCKQSNKIAGSRVVACDYYRDGQPISPLGEACGDEVGERLIAMEGPEIDNQETKEFLAFEQQCHDYGKPPGSSPSLDPDVDASNYDVGGPGNTGSALEDDHIQRVEFKSMVKNSGQDLSDGYQDFTGTNAEIRRGSQQAIYVTLGMDGSYEQHGKVWIDFDQDDSIQDETGFDLGSCNSDGCTLFGNIDVPDTAATGYTLMRVSERYDQDPPPTRTGSWSYGETEDYSLRIKVKDKNSRDITANACVIDGEVVPEGTVRDVQDNRRPEFNGFEDGGDSNDKEICLGINDGTGDNIIADNLLGNEAGGEWWDIDNWKATEYIRNHDLDSKDYRNLWQNNTDKNASLNPGFTGVEPRLTDNSGGLALEDDCYATIGSPTIECEDIQGGTGRQTPVYANFSEGAMDDDYFFLQSWLDINLAVVHNRVQTGGNTGHATTQPISEKEMVVDTESEWDQGTYSDTESDGTYLNTSEARGSADKNDVMLGEDVFGSYTSKTFDAQPEDLFTEMTVYNEFSGGDHPMVVTYAEDPSFTTNVVTEGFWLSDTETIQNFGLGAGPDHRYMKFRIGIGPEEVPAQVAFGVDQSGSMGGAISGVRSNIKWFYNQLGSEAEGTVLGANSLASGEEEPEDLVDGDGLTKNVNELEEGASRLSDGDSFEGPDSTVMEAVGYDPEASDYTSAGYKDDEVYKYDSAAKKAVIWVQDGSTVIGSSSCSNINDFSSGGLGDYMVDNNFRFYAIVDNVPGCRTNYEQAATATGGKVYDIADFRDILDDIQGDLTVLPREPLVDRVEVEAETGPDPGTGNTQDDQPIELAIEGHPEYLKWYENAEIDSRDDEWAYTPTLKWGIANNGTAWPPGACYGAPRVQGVDKRKEDATYANSYVSDNGDHWDTGYSAGDADGNWINPDNTTLSVRNGGVTCDLTGHDWGYAVQNSTVSGVDCLSGGCTDSGDPSSPGTEGVENTIPHEVVIETGQMAWDKDSDPGSYDQQDLRQWKGACGDDRNEYLIREHSAKRGGDYNPSFSGRSNYYACADRPTDCALDGEVYSQGQLVDVSDATVEAGVQSDDQEICLDVNDELPGGEWWDADNESLRDHLIGFDTAEDPEIYVRDGAIDENNPGRVMWHNMTRPGAIEAVNTPYSPASSMYSKAIGYALEDDCDRDLSGVDAGCDDTGVNQYNVEKNLIYSPFRESKGGVEVASDDTSTESTWAVKMFVAGSHGHTASNPQDDQNTDHLNFDTSQGPEGNWPTEDLNDSEIDGLEDTWAVASEPWDAVGPTGGVYDVGRCHGDRPPNRTEGWVLKNETVMANSYAMRMEVNTDSGDEGNWVDPDSTPRTVSNGTTTCDLNTTDWGIGYDTGVGSTLDVYEGDARSRGYEIRDEHAVAGPITFDNFSDPAGRDQDNLRQYPSACGDDQNEHLIREHVSYRGHEYHPDLQRENIYVCADRITDCAYNGQVYSEGQTVDLSRVSAPSDNPEMGENLSDEEICLDLNKTMPGGEWYDKDKVVNTKSSVLNMNNTNDIRYESAGLALCNYDISGRVHREGAQSGTVTVRGHSSGLGAADTFDINGADMICGSNVSLNYVESGIVKAKKRINLPYTGESFREVDLSEKLSYQPDEAWDALKKFRDHDMDHNPGTDWVSSSQRYEREEVSFFNRTGAEWNSTGKKTLTSGYVNWAAGEPNNAGIGEDCAEIYSGGEWNDIPCSYEHRGLCEFEDGTYNMTVPLKWKYANQTCYSMGGHLAVIDSASENAEVSSYGNVWIGYYQPPGSIEPSGGWSWVDRSGTFGPQGYATEDDCGPLMRKSGTGRCGDVGPSHQNDAWFSSGNFSRGGVP